nr:hypothetical protein [Tanacetum cinerariifolium]
MKDFNDFKYEAFQVLRFELSNASSLAEPVHKCGDITGLCEKRVFRRSRAFRLTFLTVDDSGGGGGVGTWDDPEAPGPLEALDGPTCGGGGDSGLEVRSIIGDVIREIEDIAYWIGTFTIDSTLVSAFLSESKGLSLKNRSSKLISLLRCCREDRVPDELADTIDSTSVSGFALSLSASEGLSLKNRSLKLISLLRCCGEDRVPDELAALTTHAAPDKRVYTMSDFTR